jgi:hypothetical protein
MGDQEMFKADAVRLSLYSAFNIGPSRRCTVTRPPDIGRRPWGLGWTDRITTRRMPHAIRTEFELESGRESHVKGRGRMEVFLLRGQK